jgi:hypothetical protein
MRPVLSKPKIPTDIENMPTKRGFCNDLYEAKSPTYLSTVSTASTRGQNKLQPHQRRNLSSKTFSHPHAQAATSNKASSLACYKDLRKLADLKGFTKGPGMLS